MVCRAATYLRIESLSVVAATGTLSAALSADARSPAFWTRVDLATLSTTRAIHCCSSAVWGNTGAYTAPRSLGLNERLTRIGRSSKRAVECVDGFDVRNGNVEIAPAGGHRGEFDADLGGGKRGVGVEPEHALAHVDARVNKAVVAPFPAHAPVHGILFVKFHADAGRDPELGKTLVVGAAAEPENYPAEAFLFLKGNVEPPARETVGLAFYPACGRIVVEQVLLVRKPEAPGGRTKPER